MMIVADKNLLKGDYLIDDDLRWKDFTGKFLHFDNTKPAEEWARIVEFFKEIK
jgi:5'(3')-deoxyribonucleotidase